MMGDLRFASAISVNQYGPSIHRLDFHSYAPTQSFKSKCQF